MIVDNRFSRYLSALYYPFRKLARLEFLQPDDSVAFFVDNNQKIGYSRSHPSSAFIQDGNLNVSLQNGQRRKATVTFGNVDGAFDYNVNRLWFGNRVRLSMGMVLPDGTDFYLPQGVFYLTNPQAKISPSNRSVTYSLSDKWAYLDGTLFGRLSSSYVVNTKTETGAATNTFDAMRSLLCLSKFTMNKTDDITQQIDPVVPVFTTYYNGKTYATRNGQAVSMTDVPYTITGNSESGTIASIMLELNTVVGGLIGYDPTGTLRVEPSQDDITDFDKPVLWTFSPKNSQLFGLQETSKDTEVYNDILVVGENLTGYEIWGRAENFDPSSDTNINLIGRKTYRINKAEYFYDEQCTNLAEWTLKRKTVMQKSVSIRCGQMFHLIENRLVAVQRTDKPGNPIEKHIINSFTLPLSQSGEMTINAVSVNDLATLATVTSGLPQ